MSNWTALAKAHFSETRHPPTDKTDKTPLSSVLSVPPDAFSENSEGVSSVSSVGVVGLFENRVFSAALMAAAMRACDHWGDGPAAREQMRQDVLDTPPDQRADLLAHFKQTYGAKPH